MSSCLTALLRGLLTPHEAEDCRDPCIPRTYVLTISHFFEAFLHNIFNYFLAYELLDCIEFKIQSASGDMDRNRPIRIAGLFSFPCTFGG
jgi:hypothetical protein